MALAAVALACSSTPEDATNAPPARLEVPRSAAGRLARDGASGPASMVERVVRYEADWEALRRFHDAPLSAARTQRLREFLEAASADLDQVEASGLALEERLDHALLAHRIRRDRARLERETARATDALALLPYAPRIVALLEARQRADPLVPRAAADELDAIARETKAAAEALEKAGTPPAARSVGLRAAQALANLRRELSEWHAFRAGYDPLFGWWTSKPQADVVTRLEAHEKALRTKVAQLEEGDQDTIVGDPIGRDALLEELALERIAHTPEELVAMARGQLAWCRAEMERAAGELGLGTDWRAALERVKSQHVEPGEQPALVRDLAREAVRFLRERDLVTVPPLAEEVWRMTMLSPEAQRVNPFFLGGEVVQVSFPTDGMSHEDKLMSLRANNRAFSRAVVHHELIPGHHLQGFMTRRHMPHRGAFGTAFWTEGWALYWEILLWELGFARTPEERVGMLFWRSHRCARIVFSLSFHLGTLSEDECVELLVTEVGHERRSAEGEVRRSFAGDYGPLYQAAYLTGGMQLRALRRELVESGRMTDRAFHDAILRGGTMPIEFVRARLLGEMPGREATWKFLR